MKITTQEQLNNLTKVEAGQEVIIESNSQLEISFNIEVWGILKIYSKVLFKNFSRVEARENSSVEAWENSSVVARENSSVEARENSSVKTNFNWFRGIIKLFGFSVAWKHKEDKFTIDVKSPNARVQEFENEKYLDREGVEVVDEHVILFKRVSAEWQTQEHTRNETIWKPGTTLEHHAWNPEKEECGEGKFHACSRPYFCDEFRSTKGDKYVAIKIHINDLFEWTKYYPSYPHKIAFRKCDVLYQCDKHGRKIA